MSEINSSQSAVNRWRLILGGITDRQLEFSGSDRDIQNFQDMEQLLDYLEKVRRKTADYLGSLNDEMLAECPEKCDKSRLELILMQFRHISTHIGMLNGLTAEKAGRLPLYVTPDSLDRLEAGYFEN